jgi:hypothetical protein
MNTSHSWIVGRSAAVFMWNYYWIIHTYG